LVSESVFKNDKARKRKANRKETSHTKQPMKASVESRNHVKNKKARKRKEGEQQRYIRRKGTNESKFY
jgi:hypothetical protein